MLYHKGISYAICSHRIQRDLVLLFLSLNRQQKRPAAPHRKLPRTSPHAAGSESPALPAAAAHDAPKMAGTPRAPSAMGLRRGARASKKLSASTAERKRAITAPNSYSGGKGEERGRCARRWGESPAMEETRSPPAPALPRPGGSRCLFRRAERCCPALRRPPRRWGAVREAWWGHCPPATGGLMDTVPQRLRHRCVAMR